MRSRRAGGRRLGSRITWRTLGLGGGRGVDRETTAGLEQTEEIEQAVVVAPLAFGQRRVPELLHERPRKFGVGGLAGDGGHRSETNGGVGGERLAVEGELVGHGGEVAA